MKNKIKLLKAERRHLKHLAPLFDAYRIFYTQPSDPEGVEKFLEERIVKNESVIFIATDESESEVYGFTQLYPLFSSVGMKRMWLLNDLFVRNEFRGKGISKMLIDAAKKLSGETHASGLMLETHKTNVIGNALYVKTGFKVIEESNFYFWKNEKELS